MELNIKVLTAAVAAAVNLILIVLVSMRNRKHIVYRSFIIVSACLLFWNLRVIISGLSNPGSTNSLYGLAITQIYYPVVTGCLYILPVAALQFTISIIAVDSNAMRVLVRGAFIAALVMSAIFATDILSVWLYDRLLWLFILPLFSLSLFLLGRAFVRSPRPLERTRFGLLFVAGTIGVGGAIADDVLVSAGADIGGLGNIANAVYSLIVATCLLRHRLFDVAVTTRRAATMLLSALTLVTVSYLLAQVFDFSDMMPYGHILVTVIILIALGHKIVPRAERFLFKGTGAHSHTLNDLRSSFDHARDSTDLLKTTVETAMDAIGAAGCLCAIRDEVSGRFTQHYSSDARGDVALHSEAFEGLIRWMDAYGSDEPLVYDELCHHLRFDQSDDAHTADAVRLVEAMQTLGYELYAPLTVERELNGMMCLGNKTNGRAFVESDVRMALTIARNSALRLQHLRMSERVRRLETLAALGEMAASVAHEIRNPLAVIRSSAQIAQSANRDERSSSMIIDECDRLNRVVTRMLDFTRTQKVEPRRIDIGEEITRWASDIVGSCAPQNAQLHIECPQQLPAVAFDPDHLKQVVTNLLLNAIEAMDGPGKIEISLSRSDNAVLVVISDGGSGIRSEDMDKIFNPFFTTKPGGSGLGLPITRRLVEMNNGTMDMKTAAGRGCSVMLELPLWKGDHG